MSKLIAAKLAKQYQALANSRRIQVIFLLEDKDLTITEIAKKLNIGVARISDYVSILENQKLVEKIRKDNKIIVKSLIKISNEGTITKKETDKI